MSKRRIFDEISKSKHDVNVNSEVNLTRDALLQNKSKWQLFLEGYRSYFNKEFAWPEYIKECKLYYGEFNIHEFIKTYGPECEEDFKHFRQRILEQKGINKPSSSSNYSSQPYLNQNLLELLVNGDNLRSRMLIRFLNPQTRAEKKNLKRSWKNAKKMKFTKAEWMKSYVGIPFKAGKPDPIDDRYTRDEIFEIIKGTRKQLDANKFENKPVQEERREEIKSVKNNEVNDRVNEDDKDKKQLFSSNGYTSFIDERKLNQDIVNNLSIFQPTQKVELNDSVTREVEKPIRLNEALSTDEKMDNISKELNELSDNFKGMINENENSFDDLLNDSELESFKNSLDNNESFEDVAKKQNKADDYQLNKADFDAIANDLNSLSQSFDSLTKESKATKEAKSSPINDTTFDKINAAIQKTTHANVNLISNPTSEKNTTHQPTKKTTSNIGSSDLSDLIDINAPTPNVRQSSSSQITNELPKIDHELNSILDFEKHVSDQIKMVMEDNALISQELKKANEIKRTEERNYEELKRQREELTQNLLNDDFINSMTKKQ